jgi:3-hydroxybutyrate dehydrogenase
MTITKQSKVAVITGASSGLGISLARGFARAGYDLALTGLESSGSELADLLSKEYGIRAFFRITDLRNSDEILAFASSAGERLGNISVLINNAGIQHTESFETFPRKKWDDIIAINLTAVFTLSQALWGGMKEQKFGRIIHIASVHGTVGSVNKAAYVASKHGVIGLTKVMALEGAPDGITVNAICPGWVDTPLAEKQVDDLMRERAISRDEAIENLMIKQPIKSFVPQDLIADTCLFLASEKASLITGSAIPIDGGWVAQ